MLIGGRDTLRSWCSIRLCFTNIDHDGLMYIYLSTKRVSLGSIVLVRAVLLLPGAEPEVGGGGGVGRCHLATLRQPTVGLADTESFIGPGEKLCPGISAPADSTIQIATSSLTTDDEVAPNMPNFSSLCYMTLTPLDIFRQSLDCA